MVCEEHENNDLCEVRFTRVAMLHMYLAIETIKGSQLVIPCPCLPCPLSALPVASQNLTV